MHTKSTGLCKWCAYIECSKCKRRVQLVASKTGACLECDTPKPKALPKGEELILTDDELFCTEDEDNLEPWRWDMEMRFGILEATVAALEWETKTAKELREQLEEVRDKIDEMDQYLQHVERVGKRQAREKRIREAVENKSSKRAKLAVN